MPVKRSTSKKTEQSPEPPAEPADGVKKSEFEIVDTQALPFNRRAYRTRHAALLEAVRSLTPGKSIVLTMDPKEGDLDSQRNRLSSAIRRTINRKYGYQHRLSFRQTSDGRLAISCESRD